MSWECLRRRALNIPRLYRQHKKKILQSFSPSRRSKQESWRVGRIPTYWLSLQPIDYFISQLLIWLAISYSLS